MTAPDPTAGERQAACTCANDGNARRCPHHTQADYESAAAASTGTSETDVRLTEAERGILTAALICRGDVYAAAERIVAERVRVVEGEREHDWRAHACPLGDCACEGDDDDAPPAVADPTAGERDIDARARDFMGAMFGPREKAPASPPVVAAPPAMGDALSALLSEFYNSDDGDYVSAFGDIHRHVAAREAATRAEERERIAQAIEADANGPRPGSLNHRAYAGHFARIAREGRG